MTGERLNAFLAGDAVDAKTTVQELARGIDFDAVDASPLANARLLELSGFSTSKAVWRTQGARDRPQYDTMAARLSASGSRGSVGVPTAWWGVEKADGSMGVVQQR